jgi:uncharacterized repeat protein (TIGR02543 family)
VNWNALITTDKTVHAKWDDYHYVVTFNKNGGDSEASPPSITVSSPYTTVRTLPTEPVWNPDANNTYMFLGWNTLANGTGTSFTENTPVSGPIIVYAKWAINQYTLSFNAQGGSPTPGSQTVDYGTLVSQPTAPTKSGWEFTGWFEAASGGTAVGWAYQVTGTKTLYAQWVSSEYTITFNNWDGTKLHEYTITAGATAAYPSTAPTPTKPATAEYTYTFSDWSPSLDVAPTQNQTYTAQFTATKNKYTLQFNTDGGSAIADQTVDYGTVVAKLSDPTKTGYIFNNWYDQSSGGSAIVWGLTITGNKTVYARWTAKTSALTLEPNGGSGAQSGVTAAYGSAMPTLTTLPARTGYTFNGYYDAATSSGTQYYNTSGASAKNWDKDTTNGTTLWAQWTLITYSDGGEPRRFVYREQ